MTDRIPVSAIVLTHNERENIEPCLESLVDLVDQLVVVDSGSTDGTADIVLRFTDELVEHPFESYADQRNWAQSALTLRHDWVLHLDADERVTPELAASIRSFFATGQAMRVAGAMFTRRTVFLGRWIRHGGHYPVFHIRLFRRDRGRCEDRLYDQHFVVDGRVARLTGDLVDVVSPDLDTWSRKHLRWAAAEAREIQRQNGGDNQVSPRLFGHPIERRRWLRLRLFQRTPPFLRALLYFIYRYVLRRGFLDGVEGLIFHVLHGFWYRFYVDAKVWENRRARRRTDDA